jgi:lipopolysaccharide export system protein LptA
MLRSEAARYARWSAAVAVLLASATGVVYLNRGWTRHEERKKAPPPAPVDVTRQSAGINFRQFDKQNQTVIFEVQASKSTEFKGQDANLLEDVKITIFGKTGDRHDVIHTRSCDYGKEKGGIHCSGDVELDLMSAADAKIVEADPSQTEARTTHVETRNVTFDRTTGLARTDERVSFAFPHGSGDANGLQYRSQEGSVRLLRNVRLRLVQPVASGGGKDKNAPRMESRPAEEVHVKGSTLDFGRDTRLLFLQGPAEAETQTEHLSAAQFSLTLDDDFRAQTLIASGAVAGNRPELTSKGTSGDLKLDADTLTAHFSPEGWVSKLDATGTVHGFRAGEAEDDEAKADSGTVDMWPTVSQPKELNLTGSVVLKADLKKTGESRVLQTSAYRMEFTGAAEHQPSRPQHAETLAVGAMEWSDAATPANPAARTRLQGDKLAMDFGDEGKPKLLQATGNVQTQRWVVGRPTQLATSRTGLAQMSAVGGWTQVDLQGDVKLREGDRNGQADHVVFLRASQTATLTGQAVARDATTETHAPRITFAQDTGDTHAEGGVRSTDFSAKDSAVQLAPVPSNITSDTLQANSKTGRALYVGHARLWQGDSVLEANSIELLRETRVLNAVGNVRAVFPQASVQSGGQAAPPAAGDGARQANTAAQPAPKKTQLWHATCAALTYLDNESRAHLMQNVVVQSADQKMRGPVLDLYFTRSLNVGTNGSNSVSAGGTNSGGSSPGGTNASGGAQQISRAVGTGGVIVEEADRRATAERGEYTAATGKFVMSGGNPTLYDGTSGTTTGRQLTFFLADDTIIVDSENGSRTLTKHRVEK